MLVLLLEIDDFKLVFFCFGLFIGFFELEDNYFMDSLFLGENKFVDVEFLFEFKRSVLGF